MFLAPGKRPGGSEAPACCNYAVFFLFVFLRGLDERKQEPIDALFEVLGMTTFSI